MAIKRHTIICPMMSGAVPIQVKRRDGQSSPMVKFKLARCEGSNCPLWTPEPAKGENQGRCGLGRHGQVFEDPAMADPARHGAPFYAR